MLKSTRDFLRLQVDAHLFELIVIEFSGRFQFLFAAELINHQPNLITGKFEANLIEGIFQIFHFNNTTFFGDLKIVTKMDFELEFVDTSIKEVVLAIRSYLLSSVMSRPSRHNEIRMTQMLSE